ncbi:MAG: TlpA family protein disulfide reductase [Thermoguttaceae bacterium]|nr:TlpA family protein disulfide reductase [Thermoguttaceae bacterium]
MRLAQRPFERLSRGAGLAVALGLLVVSSTAFAQYTPEQILKQRPTQADVEIDEPTAAETPNCSVKAFKEGGYQGVCLYAPDGTTPLRVWCAPPPKEGAKATVEQIRFFRDGREVYRDVLGKEARWLNAGGSRRGQIDKTKQIVAWISISPEEATAEIVAALATNDFDRFQRVALTAADLKTLGLGGSLAQELERQIAAADADGFAKLAAALKLPADARWGAFNGNRPATIPAGQDGLAKDLTVYYNANIVVVKGDDATQSQQLYVGDLVKVGDAWKIVGLPSGEAFGQATGEVSASSVFFPAEGAAVAGTDANDAGEIGSELTAAYQALEAASPTEYPAQCEKTFNLLLTVAAQTPSEETSLVSQAADLAFSGVQTGLYPAGAEKLAALVDVYKDSSNAELKAHVRYRQITADYYAVAQAQPRPKDSELAAAQEKYAEDLASFVEEYATTTAGAEATLSLAMNNEYMVENDAAASYYSQVAQNFPESQLGKKAAGALARLQAEGGELKLPAARYFGGGVCDLAALKGKPTVVFCWASWEPSSVDAMKRLAAGGTINVVGVNLDAMPNPEATAEEQNAFYKQIVVGLPWKNVCDPAGLDGALATALGIQNAPWIVLIDKTGKVVRSNVTSVEELESFLDEMK